MNNFLNKNKLALIILFAIWIGFDHTWYLLKRRESVCVITQVSEVPKLPELPVKDYLSSVYLEQVDSD